MAIALMFSACGVSSESPEPDDPHVSVYQSHLDKTTTIAPTSGYGDSTTVTVVDSNGNENWVGGAWYMPIPVSVGDVVGTFSAIVRDNGTANGHVLDGNNIIAVLQSRISGSTSTLASASSNGSGTQQTLTLATAHTVATGEQLVIEFMGLKGGALPGPSTVPSMTGPVTASPAAIGKVIVIPISAASARTDDDSPAAVFRGPEWLVRNATIALEYPLTVNVGDVITGFRVFGAKHSTQSTSLNVKLASFSSTNGAITQDITLQNSANAPGELEFSATGRSVTVARGNPWVLLAYSSSGDTSDVWREAEVTIARQP